MILTFIDAVKRFGDSLEEEDLGEAYMRAGNHFNRQLSQTFVVLKEDSEGTRRAQNPGRGRGALRAWGNYRGRGYPRGRGNYNRGGYSGDRGSGQGQSQYQNRGQKRGPEGDQGSKEQARAGANKKGYGVTQNKTWN